MQSYEFRAMNCAVLLAGEGGPRQTAAGFAATRQVIEAGEQRFTRFSDTSELAQLNRSAGEWFLASEEMFDLLSLALDCFQRTGGLFDPGILPDLLRLGYDRSFDLLRQEGTSLGDLAWQADPLEAGGPFGWRQPRATTPGGIPVDFPAGPVGSSLFGELQLDRERQRVWAPPGLQIDLGGIAKGWIVDRAAEVLSQHCSAGAVSAGGDMRLFSLPEEGAWQVEIEDPRQPDCNVAVLQVGPGGVATSAVTKRAWRAGGQQRHHLIDPRLGLPASDHWLSVTAVAGNAATAEAYAKALLIAGPGQAAGILSSQPSVAYLAVDRQGLCWGTKNMKELLVYEPV